MGDYFYRDFDGGMMSGFGGSYGFGAPHGFFFAGMGLLMLWSLIWKGLALWKAARRGEHWWFLGLLVINTAGILDILYLYVFTKGGPDLTHSGSHKEEHKH